MGTWYIDSMVTTVNNTTLYMKVTKKVDLKSFPKEKKKIAICGDGR